MADSQYDRPKTPESAFFLDHFRYSHSLWFIKVLSQFPSLFLQYDEDYFSSRDVKWTCQFSYLKRLHFAIEISDDNDVCVRLKMYSLIIKKKLFDLMKNVSEKLLIYFRTMTIWIIIWSKHNLRQTGNEATLNIGI